MKAAAIIPFIFTALPSTVVWAQASSAPAASQVSLMGQLVQLGGGLLLVVGLIFLMGYLMRRVGPLAPQGGQHIRLVSSLPLGPRDRLLLIDVGGKQLLLGASPGRINTLHVFEEPVAEVAASGAMPADFARTLRGLLKREPKA
ncbi:flagellar biosynthetic protein FliO [Halopseudomonas pelagia]|uniref:flagellar biosynthetic protein FliO n=1 Tax=Halopseudomonas pelagia TaxID=553151 RepID=UPI00039DA6A8|nr:flagellar biosynthetic protein FliO [Halopseudomonas pelagia]|tara:strand:+ start:134 stop:565 length:432 start_codon:yes stop_codon:yes gene_type:complete